jgi:hypothetical protein
MTEDAPVKAARDTLLLSHANPEDNEFKTNEASPSSISKKSSASFALGDEHPSQGFPRNYIKHCSGARYLRPREGHTHRKWDRVPGIEGHHHPFYLDCDFSRSAWLEYKDSWPAKRLPASGN